MFMFNIFSTKIFKICFIHPKIVSENFRRRQPFCPGKTGAFFLHPPGREMRACGNDAGTNCLPRFGVPWESQSSWESGWAFTLKTVFCMVLQCYIYVYIHVYISYIRVFVWAFCSWWHDGIISGLFVTMVRLVGKLLEICRIFVCSQQNCFQWPSCLHLTCLRLRLQWGQGSWS